MILPIFNLFTGEIADFLAREELDDVCLRDSMSIASTDSFVSAAEVRRAPKLQFTRFYFEKIVVKKQYFCLNLGYFVE